MRKFIAAAIVLIILVAAYWGWALVGVAQLASVASRGDADAVMQGPRSGAAAYGPAASHR